MQIIPKAIVSSQALTSSNATYYTATNVRTIIDKMTLTNTTGAAVLVTIDLVDSGGSTGTSERIISARSIAAGETYQCYEAIGHVLNPGDSIQGLGDGVTIRCSGREITGL